MKCRLHILKRSSSDGPRRSMIMTLKSPCFPDHIIHGTPVPPMRVLYILDSCLRGLFRATAGSILIATSLPAIVCDPTKTVPRHNISRRTTVKRGKYAPHPPIANSDSTLYLPPTVNAILNGVRGEEDTVDGDDKPGRSWKRGTRVVVDLNGVAETNVKTS